MVSILIAAALLTIMLGLCLLPACMEVSLRNRLWVEKTEGVVVGAQGPDEMHVAGPGPESGGEFLVQPCGGGQAVPLTIRPGSEFPAREGHRVVLLHLHSKGVIWLWGARNLQTGRSLWYDPLDFAGSALPLLWHAFLMLDLAAFIILINAAAMYAGAGPTTVLAGVAAFLIAFKLLESVCRSAASRCMQRALHDAGGI
jgi:hypothetical protein